MSESKTRTAHDGLLDIYRDKILSYFKYDVQQCIAATPVASREELRLLYNRARGCDISPSVFADALKQIGVSFERKLNITLPE